MEHKFRKSDNGIDLQALLDFCKKEGKMVEYRKGEQLEREGDPKGRTRIFPWLTSTDHA